MSEVTKGGGNFVGYEYQEVSASNDTASLVLDGYRSFGWISDENIAHVKSGKMVFMKLKRDRKILNKTELTRLQRHFEACVEEIRTFEKSKSSMATIYSILIGVLGTVFIAVSTFAATHQPPRVALCILFAVPGFAGWALPYFVYKLVYKHRTSKVAPLIEQKYDELYEICEKGNNLL